MPRSSAGWSGPWPAPAKLNLFLNIVGRRSDGYHLLQTVFQLLDFADTLHFRLRADAQICRQGGLPGLDQEQDLVVRAARLLAAQAGRPVSGVDIRVQKCIPAGAGLGGGSSDAATSLLVLNHLWGLGLSIDSLAQLAAGLGADVPVFVRGASAWAEGIGEQLQPMALPRRWYVVLDPGVSISTGELFAAPELTRDCDPTTMESFAAGALTSNVFEPLVLARYPRVRDAHSWLLSAAGNARLTGTGACLFAMVDSKPLAGELSRACPAPWQAWCAEGVDESPLHTCLRRQERKDENDSATRCSKSG